MIHVVRGWLLCVVIVGVQAIGYSATFILEQGVAGYSGCVDTSLFEDRPDNSAGGFPSIFSGVNRTGSPRRLLIKFDIPTTLTAGATITSVSLRLSVDSARPGVETHTLHKMGRAWNEGNTLLTDSSTIGQGTTSQPGDATWNSAMDGVTSWTAAGGDYNGTVSGTGPVDIAGTTTFVAGSGMVADVQSWLSAPAGNLGWILRGNEAAVWNAKRFVSSEGTLGLRPRLTITYTPAIVTSASEWMLFQ
jgi:hypothetical protein